MKKILFSFMGVFLFLGMPLWVGAQEESQVNQETESEWSISTPIENGVDCFDYYEFQSVRVHALPENEDYLPGQDVRFIGNITNDNDYPVVDGNLYVRIAKSRDDFKKEGYDVVDEFFVIEGVSLLANGSKDFEFTWNISPDLSGGKYVVSYFFTVGKKFNLGGLPFSNEIVAGLNDFRVNSQNSESLSFDRKNVKFNDQPYQHIGNWPSVEKGSDVGFKYNLSNTFDKNLDVLVSFTAYYWDSLREEDYVKSYEEEVTVPKNSSKEFVFNLENVDRSVYYVQAKAESGTLKSVVNTRFVVESGESPRLNYPAITGFPIKEGDKVNLFTCFHNTTYTNTEGRVELELFDEKNNLVGSVKHEGLIPSAMSAIKSEISAKKDYDYLVLKARVLDKAGNEVDKYETVYSCEQFGNCKSKPESESGALAKNISNFSVMVIVFVLLFLIVVVVVISKSMRGKKNMKIFVIFSLIGASLLFLSNQALAVAYSHSQEDPTDKHGVASGTVGITNTFSGGSASIDCGASTTFTYDPTLTYTTSGGAWDTPYGDICTGSPAYNEATCFGSDIVTNGTYITNTDKNRGGYIHWTSQKPTVTLKSSDTSVVSCDSSKLTCTGLKGGSATITASFSKVTAKIWSAINMQCNKNKANCSKAGIEALAFDEGFWGTPKYYSNKSITPRSWEYVGVDNFDYWQSPSDEDVATQGGSIYHDYSSYVNGVKGNTLEIPASSSTHSLSVGSCVVTPSVTLELPDTVHINDSITRNLTLSDDVDNVASCSCSGVIDTALSNWAAGIANIDPINNIGTQTCSCTAKSETGHTATSSDSVVVQVDKPVVDVFKFSALIGPMNNGIEFVSRNADLEWNISNALRVCGTGCVCTIEDPSANKSNVNYNDPLGKTKGFNLGIDSKDDTFKIVCKGSFDNKSSEVTTQADMFCTSVEGWEKCKQSCGDENHTRYSIDANCVKTPLENKSCGHPPCPVGSEIKETKR